METQPLRIAYAIEFLVALVAFFECWSQIGGQGPLDLMPWWLKLLFAVSFSFLVVKLTAVMVSNEPFPSIGLIRWGLAFVALLIMIALTTYFFHLNEPADEDSDEPVSATELYIERV